MTARAVVRGTGPGGAVELEIATQAGCGGCEGACLWRRIPQSARIHFNTPLALAVGEPVVVRLPERHVLIGAALLHGLPWAALVAGALAGYGLTGTDAGSVAGALAAVAMLLVGAGRLRARLEGWTLRGIAIARAEQ